jgi:hypothetical protein
MRHQVLWDTYYGFKTKPPTKTVRFESPKAKDDQLPCQIITWKAGKAPSDESKSSGGERLGSFRVLGVNHSTYVISRYLLPDMAKRNHRNTSNKLR